MSHNRKTLLQTSVVVFFLTAVFATAAHTQPWPNRPVRVIIPFPPGAGAENAARLVSNHWSKAPEELRAQVAPDSEKYGKIIRDANIRLE